MGVGYVCSCPNCGNEIVINFGCGLFFPSQSQETLEKIRAGEYGEEIRSFLEENSRGAINCQLEAFNCTNCGAWESRQELSMNLPKNPEGKGGAITTWDVQNEYETVKKYPHKCRECGGDMREYYEEELIKKAENNSVLCPHCSNPMEITGTTRWD